MGLSGSGKSTLLRMLNGLCTPTSGRVHVSGEEITSLGAKKLRNLRQRAVSMVFQNFALFPHRSVVENAAYALEARGVPKAERLAKAREFLGLVGLTDWADRLPGELSGGMRQRVGLARALAAETGILLMDEAFSALDPLIRRDMQDQLLSLQRSLDKTIVFITHDLAEAMRIGDRIAVMREGRIVQIGTPQEILTDPADDYVARFVRDVDRSAVLTAQAIMLPPGEALTLDKETTVSARAPLAELLVPAAQSPVPLAVVGDGGELLGVIPRETLLNALAGCQTGQEREVSLG
ncbi:glycine/betaine ABC transporter ATP-binding protein [Sphaerimonospora thailandensis]|uniref:Glycine/betaine ABC transporter ATP-binding protein n=2 Tax=Sphaerimonospora thailandensis TaxID=795644 RepID=A0A8J3VXG5_9ACTN|nr:glycine/betaine ABC transporter ATP-binding protein [Sphaerimonospora thailandensis]